MSGSRSRIVDLTAEFDYWTRLDNELTRAEHVYTKRTYNVLTMRRALALIREDVEREMIHHREMDQYRTDVAINRAKEGRK